MVNMKLHEYPNDVDNIDNNNLFKLMTLHDNKLYSLRYALNFFGINRPDRTIVIQKPIEEKDCNKDLYVSDYRLTTNEEYNSDKNFPGWHVLSNENSIYMILFANIIRFKKQVINSADIKNTQILYFDYCLVKCSSPNPVFIHEIEEDKYSTLANPIKVEKICFKSYELLNLKSTEEVHEYFNEYFKQNNAEYLIS